MKVKLHQATKHRYATRVDLAMHLQHSMSVGTLDKRLGGTHVQLMLSSNIGTVQLTGCIEGSKLGISVLGMLPQSLGTDDLCISKKMEVLAVFSCSLSELYF